MTALALLLALGLAPADGEAELVTEGLEAKRSMRLSGELKLRVIVHGSARPEIMEVPFEPDPERWEILGVATTTSGRWERTITLAPRLPGSLPLPPLVLRYRFGPGQDWKNARWDLEPITVIGPKDGQGSIRGETPIEGLPERPAGDSFPLVAVLLALAGMTVVALGIAAWTRRPRRRPTLSPHERALRDLEQARGSRAPLESLSIVLRRFLEERFGLPGLRRTTQEVMTAVRASAEIGAAGDDLARLLEACDRVKFAGTPATVDEIEGIFRDARDWIDRMGPAGSGGGTA